MERNPLPDSKEWWLQFLMRRFDEQIPDSLRDTYTKDGRPQTRRQRLELLWNYHTGHPPMPQVAEQYRPAFEKVMRKARVGYAGMSVSAMTNRSTLSGVSTSADNTPDGDDLAREIQEGSNFAALHKDLQEYLFVMSEAYVMVIPSSDAESKIPIMTAEDPRWCIGQPDPLRPGRLQAALKFYRDEIADQDVALLFLPGWKYTARRAPGKSSVKRFDIGQWEWDGEPEAIPEIKSLGGIPIVRFDNKMGMGEFEPHLDLLDRIMDTILLRIVITWYQSFRQRAIIGNFDEDEDVATDESGVESLVTEGSDDLDDIKDLFQADPGALWKVPEGFTFWESSQADLTPILNSVRDDAKEFAAVSHTPLYLITPDAANGSAEGASTMREALEDKVDDRQGRQSPSWLNVFRLAFAFAGEPERATGLKLLWAPVRRHSLEAQGSAIAQTKGVVSRKRQLTNIMGMSPTEVEENLQELVSDQLLDLSGSDNA